MFFNKETVVVNPRADRELLLNTPATIPFYISEVISNSQIEAVHVQAFNKDLKTITILTPFEEISENTNNDYEFTYTPLTVSKDTLYFRFKVLVNDNEHIIDSPSFSVLATGVV